MKGWTQEETDWHLLWAATEVPKEAPGVPGSHLQHLWESQENQATEKTQGGLGPANWARCFWMNWPLVCFGVSVY